MTNLKFEASIGHEILPERVLIYLREMYSFEMLPRLSGVTSILLDDLSLEVDKCGQIISVWGMCPHTRWRDATLIPPAAKPGVVFVTPAIALTRGVSIRINKKKYLEVFADKNSGWIQIQGRSSPMIAVKIFSGVVIEIDERGSLSSLWLKPQIKN